MASIHDIPNMIFKLASGKNISAFKNNLQVFNIIVAMDGKRSVSAIAKENFYEVADLADKVKLLIDQGILVPVGGSGDGDGGMHQAPAVDPTVFENVQTELTKYLGPVAGMLIKDAAKKMGHDIENFPPAKFGALLDTLATFIPNQAKASEFIQSVAAQREPN